MLHCYLVPSSCTTPMHLQPLCHLLDLSNQLVSTHLDSSCNKNHTSPVESNDLFFRHLLHLTRPPHQHRSRDPSVPPRLVATEPCVPWHWPHSCNSPHLLACHDTLACEMCWNVLEEFNLVDVVFPAKYTIRLPHVDMYISTEKKEIEEPWRSRNQFWSVWLLWKCVLLHYSNWCGWCQIFKPRLHHILQLPKCNKGDKSWSACCHSPE